MKNILLIPLDERPCNYNYPGMMPHADYNLIMPPKSIMGNKKTAGDVEAIKNFLLENAHKSDACIISMDTLLYGGIVPSRLHNLSYEELVKRAQTIEKLRDINPNMKIYLFQLIMRCPSYSLSDEEPDYYDICGEEIFLYGRYTHLEKLGKLTQKDREDFDRVKKAIKPEFLDDYLERRQKNTDVLMHNLKYIKDGVCDYFIVPQDDAAEYGFTAIDQMRVREYLKSNTLHLKTAMYPSADDIGLTLLCRAVCELNSLNRKIFVHYSSVKAGQVIPWFEDRALDETVKYHIMAGGGTRVYSLEEADIALLINMGSGMYHKWQGEYVKAYDVERNLAEFVNFAKYALQKGKIVAIGDVATANGADQELFDIMYSENLLLSINAYAGWNTSSNTLGTTLCQAVLYSVLNDQINNKKFLLLRYYEDLGYMANIRAYVTENILPEYGYTGTKIDAAKGKVSEAVKFYLTKFMEEKYPLLARHVTKLEVSMPWVRMFEAEINLSTDF